MADLDALIRVALAEVAAMPDGLQQLAAGIGELGDTDADLLLRELDAATGVEPEPSPLALAHHIMADFADRPHLAYLSERITRAVADVEAGIERRIIVEMPPRTGKSLLATQVTPAWLLSKHPDWPILVTSYSGQLATSWGRQVRRWITDGRLEGITIAPDAGAASDWETVQGGALRSRSIREPLTGYGARVLIVDDPHKDHADAHSKHARDEVWNWWQSVAQTRLQPPSLVIVIMTRWHEDDLVGRLLSTEHDGDPDDWEVIRLPAIAEEGDVLGRELGEPLLSPLVAETIEEANRRWELVKRAVGSYTWSALYQQRPAPAEGAIFSMDSWRYWTTDPALVDGDRVLPLPDERLLAQGQWVDSWDLAFKGVATSDWVVGQRWVRVDADRYLIAQSRDRSSFTETQERMLVWARTNDPAASPYGRHVHKRLVEDAANGPAILDSLRRKIAGLKAIKADKSKEARARAVTPEIESGNVIIPYPAQPGHEWVNDYLSEFRNFPNDAHDDQVDATTQALAELRDDDVGVVHAPPSAVRARQQVSTMAALRTGGRVIR